MDDEKSRVTKGGWILLYASAVIVDAVEILIGIVFPIAGEVINEIINVVYGILLAFYLHRKGISMVKGKNLFRFLAAFGIDEITMGFAPAWTIDVFLTHRSVKKSDVEARTSQRKNRTHDVVGPLNESGVRMPNRSEGPLNSNGVRAPRKV